MIIRFQTQPQQNGAAFLSFDRRVRMKFDIAEQTKIIPVQAANSA